MKKTLLLLTALCASVRADDIALLDIRFDDGTIRQVAIEFYGADAPQTVANFKKLADKGFYKGLAFHRAIPTAIVQTGDPLSKKTDRSAVGTGGPGYTLPPEIHRRHTKGAVAAARIGDKVNPQRRSNGSQFYVCVSPQPQLDGKYTVFGNVIRGLDVLESISNRSADTNDYPIERILLKKVSIVPREKISDLPAPVTVSKPDAPLPKSKRNAVPPVQTPQPAPEKKSFWSRMWPQKSAPAPAPAPAPQTRNSKPAPKAGNATTAPKPSANSTAPVQAVVATPEKKPLWRRVWPF